MTLPSGSSRGSSVKVQVLLPAGGAIGGLIGGPSASSAGTVLSKFLKHPIKNLLADLSETLLMDFTNWYSQFVTEGVIDSYA